MSRVGFGREQPQARRISNLKCFIYFKLDLKDKLSHLLDAKLSQSLKNFSCVTRHFVV